MCCIKLKKKILESRMFIKELSLGKKNIPKYQVHTAQDWWPKAGDQSRVTLLLALMTLFLPC